MSYKDYLSAFGKYIWKWAAGSFIVFSIIRWLSPRKINPTIDLEIIVIVFGITASMSLLWLISVFATRLNAPAILIREKDIIYMSVSGRVKIDYKKIQSCNVGATAFDGQKFGVLQIRYWDGNESFIEIASHIKNEAVIEILESKNIQIKPFLYKLN